MILETLETFFEFQIFFLGFLIFSYGFHLMKIAIQILLRSFWFSI